jgi:protein-tyrosine phosphatase
MSAHRILVACMGNICRSPMAEGLLRAHAQRLGIAAEFDSAGTHGYHVGAPPDPRARQVCRARGIDIDGLRAREVVATDFEHFDWVLVADRDNLATLRRRFGSPANLDLMLGFAGIAPPLEVPDPYYGGLGDFESVFALLDRAASGVLQRLTSPA